MTKKKLYRNHINKHRTKRKTHQRTFAKEYSTPEHIKWIKIPGFPSFKHLAGKRGYVKGYILNYPCRCENHNTTLYIIDFTKQKEIVNYYCEFHKKFEWAIKDIK